MSTKEKKEHPLSLDEGLTLHVSASDNDLILILTQDGRSRQYILHPLPVDKRPPPNPKTYEEKMKSKK